MAKGETAYYFGCYDLAGHYLYAAQNFKGEPAATRMRYFENQPWGKEVDGGLCPKFKNQNEGEALIHHKDGWTALAFWDRSGNQRLNSNSVFMQKGTHDFAGMVEFAQKAFPFVWMRFRFQIIDVSVRPVISKDSGKSRQIGLA